MPDIQLCSRNGWIVAVARNRLLEKLAIYTVVCVWVSRYDLRIGSRFL